MIGGGVVMALRQHTAELLNDFRWTVLEFDRPEMITCDTPRSRPCKLLNLLVREFGADPVEGGRDEAPEGFAMAWDAQLLGCHECGDVFALLVVQRIDPLACEKVERRYCAVLDVGQKPFDRCPGEDRVVEVVEPLDAGDVLRPWRGVLTRGLVDHPDLALEPNRRRYLERSAACAAPE